MTPLHGESESSSSSLSLPTREGFQLQSPPSKQVRFSLKWGVLFCFFQIVLVLLIAPKNNGWIESYFKLNEWDTFHYYDIAEKGYHIPPGILTSEDVHSNRANVGYFPAYPLIVSGVAHLFSLPTQTSTLVVAQVFCVLFWIQFFLWLGLLPISPRIQLLLASVLLFFPSSFFLVAGYSESLFMTALMGLILWTECWIKRTKCERIDRCFIMAALCGFLLSSTRLVGIPLVIYPILRWFSLMSSQQSSPHVSLTTLKKEFYLSNFRLWRLIALAVLGSLGGLSFFLWCQVKFGHWDLYFQLQQLGWGNHPNFLAILFPSSYLPQLFFEDTRNSICRASNLFILILFWFVSRNFKRDQFSLLWIGLVMFLISLAGKANYEMDSMVRYNLPVFLVLILLIVSLSGEDRLYQIYQNRRNKILFWMGCFIAIAFQIWMIRVFTKGGWVA